MAKTVTVYAAEDFEHQGKAVAVGDPIAVSPIEAASLKYRKKVSLVKPRVLPKAMTAEPEPEPVTEPNTTKPRRRRTYKRRDLRAEE